MNGFDAWLAYLFDRPADDDSWDGRPHAWLDRYAGQDTPVAAAQRIRELFGNAGTLLRPHSDDQVARGLLEIVDGGELHALCSPRVPVVLRTGGLRSIVRLFAEVFAARIEVEHPRHLPKLQHACFMFFDIAPIDLGDDTVLDVLEDTLALPSVPCQRSALHGLGHAYWKSPQQVPAIVDRWLARNRHAPAELRDYAAGARAGQVM
ncbi:hypothetical protein [Catellatospora sichuanensis]|uniref:hypothetical protein n=1 Tax=Catellatospora sichuanensis TaxID=1969805 RepID=UPI001182CFC7|nr:hypothetical protein [Catellatospora sichuanensis]